MAVAWVGVHLLLFSPVVTSFRTKASGSNEAQQHRESNPSSDCHGEVGKQYSQEDKEKCMVQLIEEINADASFQSFAQARDGLLHRVNLAQAFGEDTEQANQYKEKEDSVFSFVKSHSDTRKKKLDTYSEQFQNKHGIDHLPFTEQWILENAGEEIQLEGVMEHPTFEDFTGVYDMKPMSNMYASKMIIDENDFMGMYNLGSGEADVDSPGTYEGVDVPDSLPAEDPNKVNEILTSVSDRLSSQELSLNRSSNNAHTTGQKASCGCSDAKEHVQTPHALGEGEYIQFRLRNENVRKFMDNSRTSHELNKLIPDTPNEPIYLFTVSANGVMRFHPWGGMARKMWHALGDSETTTRLPWNIAHAGTFGCFCFGITYKERQNYQLKSGEVVKGGRTIVMRYNRWATDNVPVYAMIRQHADKVDASIPEQPGSMFAGFSREILEELFQKLKIADNLNKWLGITGEDGKEMIAARRLNGRGYPDENPILALGQGDNITSTSTHIKDRSFIATGGRFATSYGDVFDRMNNDIPGLGIIKQEYMNKFRKATIHANADSLTVCGRKIPRGECWGGFAEIKCAGGAVHLSCLGVGLGEPCLQRASVMSVLKPRPRELASMCGEGKCKCVNGNAPPIERCTCQKSGFW